MLKKRVLLIVLLLLLSTPFVAANFFEDLNLNQPYNGSYQRNQQLVDFGVFFVIFMAVIWVGTTALFTDAKHRNPSLALSLVLSLTLAVSALKAGLSASGIVDFMWHIAFILAILFLWYLMMKVGNLESSNSKFISLFVSAIIVIFAFIFFAKFG